MKLIILDRDGTINEDSAEFIKTPEEWTPLPETGWGYEAWAERANNASLTLLGTYDGLVNDFVALFDRQGQDFTRFYVEVERLTALPTAHERRQALKYALQVPR